MIICHNMVPCSCQAIYILDAFLKAIAQFFVYCHGCTDDVVHYVFISLNIHKFKIFGKFTDNF